MELFLLLAMALSLVSFISIVLNKPAPSPISEVNTSLGRVTPAEFPFQSPEPSDWTLPLEEETSAEELLVTNLPLQPAWVSHSPKKVEEAPIPFEQVGR